MKTIHKQLVAAVASTAALGALAGTPPALDITQNTDIAAGRAAIGPARTIFDWTGFFPSGTVWAAGSLGPDLNGPIGIGTLAGDWVFSADGSSLHLGNWIDGNGHDPSGYGFNAPDGAAAPELAINGVESFSFAFAAPLNSVGLAISTGLANLPTEVDHLGAVFEVTTDTGGQGKLTLPDTGSGYSAWVGFASNSAFSVLTLTELSGNAADQYFGNVYAPVPEPGGLVLGALGLVGLGAARLKRR